MMLDFQLMYDTGYEFDVLCFTFQEWKKEPYFKTIKANWFESSTQQAII